MNTILEEEKKTELLGTPIGSTVLLTNGDTFELVKVNRTKFVGKNLNDNRNYNIPITMFVKVTETKKIEPKKLNKDYLKLNEGDYFIIKYKDVPTIFKFVKMNTKNILAINPITGGRIRIDPLMFLEKLNINKPFENLK
jgi:hypothetical protein